MEKENFDIIIKLHRLMIKKDKQGKVTVVFVDMQIFIFQSKSITKKEQKEIELNMELNKKKDELMITYGGIDYLQLKKVIEAENARSLQYFSQNKQNKK